MVPADYVVRPLRWPDGPIDEVRAVEDGRLGLLRFLREAALQVRAARGGLAHERLAQRASVYEDAVSRLERGTAWLDVETLLRLFEVLEFDVVISPSSDGTAGPA